MKQIKAFIFDLDGTLLDTLQDLYLCCNYALRTHGMPERTLEEVCNFVGNGVKKLMERSVPGGLSNPAFEDAFTTFRQYYLLHSLDNTHPYPGIIEALRELDERGMKLAVVSNKFYKATQELCRHFFNDYIKIAIGEREGIRKKSRLCANWVSHQTRRSMSETAMWILPPHVIATSPALVFFGDSGLRNSCWNMVQLP